MILLDISSAFHISVHHIAKQHFKKKQLNILNYEDEFYKGMFYLIDKYTSGEFARFGEAVICLDDKSGKLWRKDVYPAYKQQRKKLKESNLSFDYNDAYQLFDKFLENTEKFSGIKHVKVEGCEADDVILTIGEHLIENRQPVMIASPDKDFIQLQYSPLVSQYSWRTHKPVLAEDKGSLQEWLVEHVCLGDHADNVPRIVDFQEFKPGVVEYLKEQNIEMSPLEFSRTFYNPDDFEQFGGVFNNPAFGPASLKKLIQKFGGIENFVNSDPVIKANYDMNSKLVLASGIPLDLKAEIKKALHKPATSDIKQLANNLNLEVSDLPEIMKNKLYAEQLAW